MWTMKSRVMLQLYVSTIQIPRYELMRIPSRGLNFLGNVKLSGRLYTSSSRSTPCQSKCKKRWKKYSMKCGLMTQLKVQFSSLQSQDASLQGLILSKKTCLQRDEQLAISYLKHFLLYEMTEACLYFVLQYDWGLQECRRGYQAFSGRAEDVWQDWKVT